MRELPSVTKLTPINHVDGHREIFFKRDDLFAYDLVNGGKLRQAIYLMEKERDLRGATTFITGASVLSPQIPIIATVAHAMGAACHIFVGCGRRRLERSNHGQIAASKGAHFHYVNCPRTNVLQARARELASTIPNSAVVKHGMSEANDLVYFGLVAHQVVNCPDADTLIVTCGSAMNAIGILSGVSRYARRYKRIILFGVAPNREALIAKFSGAFGGALAIPEFHYVDAFGTIPGYSYEKQYPISVGSIDLHPRYEAKAMKWLMEKNDIFGTILFWIVGGPIGQLKKEEPK